MATLTDNLDRNKMTHYIISFLPVTPSKLHLSLKDHAVEPVYQWA